MRPESMLWLIFSSFFSPPPAHSNSKGPVWEVVLQGARLSDEQRSLLSKPLFTQDVKEAIFSIDNNKNPVPDGFGSQFYKSAWDIIHKDVTRAVLYFFEKGKLL